MTQHLPCASVQLRQPKGVGLSEKIQFASVYEKSGSSHDLNFHNQWLLGRRGQRWGGGGGGGRRVDVYFDNQWIFGSPGDGMGARVGAGWGMGGGGRREARVSRDD